MSLQTLFHNLSSRIQSFQTIFSDDKVNKARVSDCIEENMLQNKIIKIRENISDIFESVSHSIPINNENCTEPKNKKFIIIKSELSTFQKEFELFATFITQELYEGKIVSLHCRETLQNVVTLAKNLLGLKKDLENKDQVTALSQHELMENSKEASDIFYKLTLSLPNVKKIITDSLPQPLVNLQKALPNTTKAAIQFSSDIMEGKWGEEIKQLYIEGAPEIIECSVFLKVFLLNLCKNAIDPVKIEIFQSLELNDIEKIQEIAHNQVLIVDHVIDSTGTKELPGISILNHAIEIAQKKLSRDQYTDLQLLCNLYTKPSKHTAEAITLYFTLRNTLNPSIEQYLKNLFIEFSHAFKKARITRTVINNFLRGIPQISITQSLGKEYLSYAAYVLADQGKFMESAHLLTALSPKYFENTLHKIFKRFSYFYDECILFLQSPPLRKLFYGNLLSYLSSVAAKDLQHAYKIIQRIEHDPKVLNCIKTYSRQQVEHHNASDEALNQLGIDSLYRVLVGEIHNGTELITLLNAIKLSYSRPQLIKILYKLKKNEKVDFAISFEELSTIYSQIFAEDANKTLIEYIPQFLKIASFTTFHNIEKFAAILQNKAGLCFSLKSHYETFSANEKSEQNLITNSIFGLSFYQPLIQDQTELNTYLNDYFLLTMGTEFLQRKVITKGDFEHLAILGHQILTQFSSTIAKELLLSFIARKIAQYDISHAVHALTKIQSYQHIYNCTLENIIPHCSLLEKEEVLLCISRCTDVEVQRQLYSKYAVAISAIDYKYAYSLTESLKVNTTLYYNTVKRISYKALTNGINIDKIKEIINDQNIFNRIVQYCSKKIAYEEHEKALELISHIQNDDTFLANAKLQVATEIAFSYPEKALEIAPQIKEIPELYIRILVEQFINFSSSEKEEINQFIEKTIILPQEQKIQLLDEIFKAYTDNLEDRVWSPVEFFDIVHQIVFNQNTATQQSDDIIPFRLLLDMMTIFHQKTSTKLLVTHESHKAMTDIFDHFKVKDPVIAQSIMSVLSVSYYINSKTYVTNYLKALRIPQANPLDYEQKYNILYTLLSTCILDRVMLSNSNIQERFFILAYSIEGLYKAFKEKINEFSFIDYDILYKCLQDIFKDDLSSILHELDPKSETHKHVWRSYLHLGHQ